MRIHPFRALIPNFDRITSMEAFCEQAKFDYHERVQSGDVRQRTLPAVFIYEIITETSSHIGILALNAISDYHIGRIKKHEKTLLKREQEYHALLQQWQAVIKPVLLTYTPIPEVNKWINSVVKKRDPNYSVEISGEQHRFWVEESDAKIWDIQRIFERQVTSAYIADGHHRTTTIAQFDLLQHSEHAPDVSLNFKYVFCAYFDSDQLKIKGYHRTFELDKNFDWDHFLTHLSHNFKITPLLNARLPLKKHEIVLVFDHHSVALTWTPPPPTVPPTTTLDANLLNELILHTYFGVTDPRTDHRIGYVDGNAGLKGILNKLAQSESKMGILLHPVLFNDLKRLSDQGQVLPPKSTWFEPRIKSGLMAQSLISI
jgi:uncharacterized protein (DUF1015 family)